MKLTPQEMNSQARVVFRLAEVVALLPLDDIRESLRAFDADLPAVRDLRDVSDALAGVAALRCRMNESQPIHDRIVNRDSAQRILQIISR